MDDMVLERVPAPVVSRPQTLAGVLAALEIGVYPLAQVEAFKRRFWWQMIRRRLAFPVVMLFCTLLATSVTSVCAVVLGGRADAATQDLLQEGLFVLGAAVCGLVAVFMMIGVFVSLSGIAEEWRTTRWRNQRLDSYGWVQGLIQHWFSKPAAVDDLIHRVHVACPEATFSVESLSVDPFLYVEWRGQRYCIAHWDEPGFQDR